MGKLKYLHTVKKFPSGKFLVILESGGNGRTEEGNII